MKLKIIFLLGLILILNQTLVAHDSFIDLSGIWRFQLDPMGFSQAHRYQWYKSKISAETIMLPGSTDQGGKGIRNTVQYLNRLSRKFEYMGAAWYQREVVIPDTWSEKEIILHLERCHWETTVYVDGKLAGTGERLSSPNRFILTEWLTPGIHTLTLCVDNHYRYPLDLATNALTEHTQTNWNGIVGKIGLEAKEKTYIKRMDVYPDPAGGKIRVNIEISSSEMKKGGKLILKVKEKEGNEILSHSYNTDISDSTKVTHEISMGKTIKFWDEFTPFLYILEASLYTDGKCDCSEVCFGMRNVEQGKHHIRLNGRNIHLRGALDDAEFPLTGYPSTDVADWRRIFETVKNYGMNHIRFHSWCPPEASFIAADELGIYLQVELPICIEDLGKYPTRRDFFENEMYAVLNEYGNHPSFIMLCNGNENEGESFDEMEDLVVKARLYDNRRLYSASTARKHVKPDQYYVSHVTEKGMITVYEVDPSTLWDLNETSDIDVPVIAHEAGQRCMFPNFNEIVKYTGVLEPRNFEVFRQRLTENGMLHQADDFFRATGAHTVLQYKGVIESLLRSSNSGGFQLLGLQDYPGQGCAFVGILDAFWETKGLVSPEKFRESCAPTVLLARFPKRVYNSGETFNARIEIYHYGKDPVKGKKMTWQLENEIGSVIAKGSKNVPMISCATVDSLGMISVNLEDAMIAQKLTLKVQIENIAKNEWDIWVYPPQKEVSVKDCEYVRVWDSKTKSLLAQGKKVLFVPEKCNGRKGHFAGYFWTPIHFRSDEPIVGTLIDHSHPAFRDFPTSYYADWQWWDILNYSTALDINEFKDIHPIIQSIDTYEFNVKLGIAFETQVGKGKLFILAVDPEKDIENRMATKQLLFSVMKYVGSEQFNPACKLQEYQLDKYFDVSLSNR